MQNCCSGLTHSRLNWEHLLQESGFVDARIWLASVCQGFGLFDGFVLADIFLVHNKVDHVQAFAVGLAVGRKAVGRMGFIIDLQAWGLVFMERAMQPHTLIRLQCVMFKHLGQG